MSENSPWQTGWMMKIILFRLTRSDGHPVVWSLSICHFCPRYETADLTYPCTGLIIEELIQVMQK
jgi:hypothetical protein